MSNNCTHVIDQPAFYTRPTQWKKPNNTIDNVCASLSKWYHDCKDDLPNLRFNNRDKRSERRETIACLLQFLFNRLDFNSMTAIYFKDGKKNNIRVSEIAKQLNLSVSRVNRAITDLVKAGYIVCNQTRKTNADGKIVANISIKRITAECFWHLGVARDKLNSVIQYVKTHSKRIVSKAEQYANIKAETNAPANQKKLANLLGGMFGKHTARGTSRESVPATDNRDDIPRRAFFRSVITEPTDADIRQARTDALSDKFKSVTSPADCLAMLKKFRSKR